MHRQVSTEAVSLHKTLKASLLCHYASLMELLPLRNLDHPDLVGFLENNENLGFLLGIGC